MTAPSGRCQVGAVLVPLCWRLEDPPPVALLATAASSAATPPLLVIDRREPLPEVARSELAACLSSPERQRLAALRQPGDRERFLRGRGALRLLLGAWLGQPGEAVAIQAAPRGKPCCPGGPEFNVSHSGELILLALHPSRPVGVDVERERPDLDWRPIARRMLPVAEAEALEQLAHRQGARAAAAAFFSAWCRLEARLKARGLGLAAPGEPPLRREAGEDLWDVAVPVGYRAAVALTAHPAAVAGACPPGPPG